MCSSLPFAAGFFFFPIAPAVKICDAGCQIPKEAFVGARLGQVLYWLGSIMAGLIALVGVLVLFGEKPAMSLLFFIPAAIVWGIGRAILYVLAGGGE